MRPSSHHVVMVVTNHVLNDGRVQKAAFSMAAAGYEVTVVGCSPSDRFEEGVIGPARLVRVPMSLTFKEAGRKAHERRRKPRRRKLEARTRLRIARRQTRIQLSRAERSDAVPPGDSRRGPGPAIGFLTRLNRLERQWAQVLRTTSSGLHLVEQKASRVSIHVRARSTDRRVDWREQIPVLLDYELALVPVIVRLMPDLIHAHDHLSLSIAETARVLSARDGRHVKVLYDAHEYVRGLPELGEKRLAAHIALEKEFIRRMDAVVTVSPTIAERLERDHRLRRRPDIVLNAPFATTSTSQGTMPIRVAVDVPQEVPLLVYSGAIKAQRGLDTVIDALPDLPDVHCALVASSPTLPGVIAVLERARDLGCQDRVHVAPFVEPAAVPSYLSSADLGLHPLLPSGNADLALPTKIFEYLFAGLPVLVSDLPEMGRLVRELGLGETFEPGNPQSFAAVCQRVLADLDGYRRASQDPAVRRRFSWEAQAATLEAAYNRVLSGARRAPAVAVGAPTGE